jgi:hypothetical protein
MPQQPGHAATAFISMSFIRIISCKEVRDVGRGLQAMFAKFPFVGLYTLVSLMYSASYG